MASKCAEGEWDLGQDEKGVKEQQQAQGMCGVEQGYRAVPCGKTQEGKRLFCQPRPLQLHSHIPQYFRYQQAWFHQDS